MLHPPSPPPRSLPLGFCSLLISSCPQGASMGNLLCSFRSKSVALKVAVWASEPCSLKVTTCFSFQRSAPTIGWKAWLVGFLQGLSPKRFLPSPHQLQNQSLPRTSGGKPAWFHHFTQMANPGGGAVCNGNLHNHGKQSDGSPSGNCVKNGIVKEAQVRGEPSPVLGRTWTFPSFFLMLLGAAGLQVLPAKCFVCSDTWANFKGSAMKKLSCGLRGSISALSKSGHTDPRALYAPKYKHTY